MIREQAMRAGVGNGDASFRLRGSDVSRLEGFSDAVFAFAVTLLVVSLEAPVNYAELIADVKDLLPFGICFAALTYLWYRHYIFFRRYGLHDATMVALNAALLFVVLAYVYPLKFLFRSFIGAVVFHESVGAENVDQLANIFIIYGFGFAAVYGVFALFHVHAYRQRDALGLDPVEALITRSGIVANLIVAAVGLISALLAYLHVGIVLGTPGWVYFLLFPTMAIFGRYETARRKALAASTADSAPEQAPPPSA